MHNGIVNRRDKLQADNVNKPVLDTAFVTDNVSEHIVEIIDDHKEDIIAIIGRSIPSYSTDEQDVNAIWVDGKKLYARTFIFENGLPVSSQNTSTGILVDYVDHIIAVESTSTDRGGYTANNSMEAWKASTNNILYVICNYGNSVLHTLTIYYTKIEEE